MAGEPTKALAYNVVPDTDRVEFLKGKYVEYKESGVSIDDAIGALGVTGVVYIESDKPVVIPTDKRLVIIRFQLFETGTELVQPMPDITQMEDAAEIIIDNASTDPTHKVKLVPSSSDQSVGGGGSFFIRSLGETVFFAVHKVVKNFEDIAIIRVCPDTFIDSDDKEIYGITKMKFSKELEIDRDESDLNLLNVSVKAGSGIEFDDGDTDAAAINKVNLKGIKITEVPNQGGMGADEIEITSGVNIFMQTDPQAGNGLTNRIKVLPPLSVYDDPAGDIDTGLIFEIKPGTFEPLKAPGYLAYLRDSEEVIGKHSDGTYHKGVLWFDDQRKDPGPYIVADRTNKAFGIQEWDNKDPNITGGQYFIIVFVMSLVGVAPNDGTVRFGLINKAAVPSDPSKGYLLDSNGAPIIGEITFKAGEKLQPDPEKPYIVSGIVNAKGLKEFQCFVSDNFADDLLELADPTEGGTGIMIQALGSTDKIGDAFQQVELDEDIRINYSSHYLGPFRMSVNWLIAEDQPVKTGDAGQGETMNDGYGLYNISTMKYGAQNGHLLFEDDGTHICDFNFHRIFSAEETVMMRGKQEKVTVTLVDKNSGWNVALMKWTGKPDEYTKEIFTSRNNTIPVFQPGWVKTDEMFISEDIVSGDHTQDKTFTIPSDANNYAFMIYPTSGQLPLTLMLKQFQADVVVPFIGFVEHYPTYGHEKHLIFDEQYKQFIQDNQGYASLRYTIGDVEIPCPCGELGKGAADVSLDTTVNKVTGSQARGGEGAILFNASGNASFSGDIRISNEQATTSEVTVWFAKVIGSAGSETYDEIAESENSYQVPANTKNMHFRFRHFTEVVSPGDRFAVRMMSDKTDGAYIESDSPKLPMISLNLDFKELVPGSEDEPIQELYIHEPILDNDYALTAGTDGRVQSLLVGDLPENTRKHVLQGDFSGNDFNIDEAGGISIKDYIKERDTLLVKTIDDFGEPEEGETHVKIKDKIILVDNTETFSFDLLTHGIEFENCWIKANSSHLRSSYSGPLACFRFINCVVNCMDFRAEIDGQQCYSSIGNCIYNSCIFINKQADTLGDVSGVGNEYTVFETCKFFGFSSTSNFCVHIKSDYSGNVRFDGCDFQEYHNILKNDKDGTVLVFENCKMKPIDNTQGIVLFLNQPLKALIFVDNAWTGRTENFCNDLSKLDQDFVMYDCQHERSTFDVTKEYISPDQAAGLYGLVFRQYFVGDKATGTVLVNKATVKLIMGKVYYEKAGKEMSTCCNADVQLYRKVADQKVYVGKSVGTITDGYIDYTL